jgi:endonuclease/exonuclease/phosphatase family metal-dependent hydrolase
VLIRSWNLFHGNTWPPQRHAFLDEMIALATADDPDVVCFQEVPAWALERFTVGDVAARPMFGAIAGRALTAPHHGVIRSAFSGQGNAIWVSPRLRVRSHDVLTLNSRRFRARVTEALDLPLRTQLAWAKERRIVQAVRMSSADHGHLLVANTHCTSFADEPRIAEAELTRAAWFADSVARPDDILVLAGDFNVTPDTPALHALAEPEWGLSAAGPRIDHILVRGAAVTPLRVWDDKRRRRADGSLLSDHAPVELEIL